MSDKNQDGTNIWSLLKKHLSEEEQITILKEGIFNISRSDTYTNQNKDTIASALKEIATLNPKEAEAVALVVSRRGGLFFQSRNIKIALFHIAYAETYKYLRENRRNSLASEAKLITFPASNLLLRQDVTRPLLVLTDPNVIARKYIDATARFRERKREIERLSNPLYQAYNFFRNILSRTNSLSKTADKSTSDNTLSPQISSVPSVSSPSLAPDKLATLQHLLVGPEAYLLTSLLEASEDQNLLQKSLDNPELLATIATLLPDTQALDQSGNERENSIRFHQIGANTQLPLPLNAKVAQIKDDQGTELNTYQNNGRAHLKNESDGVNVKFLLADSGYPTTNSCSIAEIKQMLPKNLDVFAKVSLDFQFLPPEIQNIIEQAKILSADKAATLLQSFVQKYLTYDTTADHLYENLHKSPQDDTGDGHHPYLERIIKTKRGVCSQASRLLAELLRHAGITCIEANVLFALNHVVTKNDYHRLPLAILPDLNGKLTLFPIEATGLGSFYSGMIESFAYALQLGKTAAISDTKIEDQGQKSPNEILFDEAQELTDEQKRVTVPLNVWKLLTPLTISPTDEEFPSQTKIVDLIWIAEQLKLSNTNSPDKIIIEIFNFCLSGKGLATLAALRDNLEQLNKQEALNTINFFIMYAEAFIKKTQISAEDWREMFPYSLEKEDET